MNEAREFARAAEEAGFWSTWYTEHHFGHEGIEITPNPVLMSADIAARTSRIRIGQAASIITFWHPMRLAEDLAMRDHNSSETRSTTPLSRPSGYTVGAVWPRRSGCCGPLFVRRKWRRGGLSGRVRLWDGRAAGGGLRARRRSRGAPASGIALADLDGGADLAPTESVGGCLRRPARGERVACKYPSVRRHSALVPLSHDHQHGLVVARRMARAGSESECRRAADDFVQFVEGGGSDHFREEEEIIFPLLAAYLDEPSELLDRALVEHGRLRAAAVRFGWGHGTVDGKAVAAVARLLEAHIRCEEREIFPLVERIVPGDVLTAVGLATRVQPNGAAEVVDLADLAGDGTLWAVASVDLNATVVAWPPGGAVAEHRNGERDVLLVVIAGDGTLEVDRRRIELRAQRGVMVPRGTVRRVSAGPRGLRYLSIHLRRSGLTQIRPRSPVR